MPVYTIVSYARSYIVSYACPYIVSYARPYIVSYACPYIVSYACPYIVSYAHPYNSFWLQIRNSLNSSQYLNTDQKLNMTVKRTQFSIDPECHQ